MSLPRKNRGEWRPMYEALVTHPTFLAFSRDAKLVFYTLKLTCGAVGIRTFAGFEAALAEMTNISRRDIPKAVAELVASGWVKREGAVVWIVEGLENEPQLSHGEKHKRYVANQIAGLPSCKLVTEFRTRYAEFLPDVPTVSDRLSHSVSLTLSHGVSDTTPLPLPQPQPQIPTTIPIPMTTDSESESSVQQRGRWLVVAANKGISEKYGDQPRPIMATSPSSYKAINDLHAAGVDFEIAAALIFDYAKTANPSDGKPPQFLGYFTQYVLKKWHAYQAKIEASAFNPGAVPDVIAPREGDQLRSSAIQYAREGIADWIDYCDTRDIPWREAA